MKRTPLIFAALTPLVAAAGDGDKAMKVDHEELRDDWRVSEIIGSDAHSSDGENVGEIKDVILTDDGDIASILVDAGGLQNQQSEPVTVSSESGTGGTEQPAEEIYTERGSGPATAGSDEMQASDVGGGSESIVAVQWQDPSFNPEENVVDLTVSSSEFQRLAAATAAVSGTSVDMQRRDGQTDIYGSDRAMGGGDARTGTTELDATGTGDLQTGTTGTDTRTVSAKPGLSAGGETADAVEGNIRASELLGMDVHFADEQSYGEVDDVLISQDGKASAYIIDAGNFFQTEQYALPADASVDMQQEAVRYEMTSGELESMEEFDLDENLQST